MSVTGRVEECGRTLTTDIAAWAPEACHRLGAEALPEGRATTPIRGRGRFSACGSRWSSCRSTGLPRPPAEPAIRSRSMRLHLTAMRADQRRDADDVDLRLPAIGEARHANACVRPAVRVCREICRQYGANRAFRLRRRLGRRVHRQPRHVRADGAAGFGLENHWIENRHSTPASRRMRLPNRPGSFLVWTATQTSLPDTGCLNSRWLPFPDRAAMNPAAFSLRMTSAHATDGS